MKGKLKYNKNNSGLSILLTCFATVLLIVCVMLVSLNSMKNTQEFGKTLVQSYAMDEQNNIDRMCRYVDFASMYVEEIEHETGNPEEIQKWLQDYFYKMTKLIGEGYVDSYAVIDGKIIAANPWEGDEEYDFSSKQWYKEALNKGHKLVFSDVYEDAVTGSNIITISKELASENDVIAVDVYMQNPKLHSSSVNLPEGYAYYLCDSRGKIIYSEMNGDHKESEIQQHVDMLIEGIKSGEYDDFTSNVRGINGEECGVYNVAMDNGWSIIVTIPLNSILSSGNTMVVRVIFVVAAILFVLLFILALRDIRKNKKVQKDDETIRILGDSFYAIIRINFIEATYEAIKFSDEIRKSISPSGKYDVLLQAVRNLMSASTYDEFEKAFSIESIKKRVDDGISDFGGDFQRLFDGEYRWVNIRTLYDKDVSKNEVIWCFKDVEEEKKQQLQHTVILKDALSSAWESTKAKTEFFNCMSHDMRTPLNAIIGFAKLARDNCKVCDREKLEDYLKKIDFAGNQLLALVNDILELSRINAGKEIIDVKEFDIIEFMADVTGIFAEMANSSKKEFVVDMHVKDRIVEADSKKIGKLLNNLLSNALKFTEKNDKIITEVRQIDINGYSKLQLIVEDTGIGMSDKFLKHIFEPYSRETNFTTKNTVGTGLGMSIVSSIVNQMNGEISVESKIGEGSKFTVTLPVRFVVDNQKNENNKKSNVKFDWDGKSVLVAEDNELNMEIVTEMLSLKGARVIPAKNGLDAVEIFRKMNPGEVDLILMDMQMPVMDGCEATRTIRAMEKSDATSVPIIAVTANAFAEDINKTTSAGMNGHVSKPIDFDKLTVTVREIIDEID